MTTLTWEDKKKLLRTQDTDEAKKWLRSEHSHDLGMFASGRSMDKKPIKRSRVVAQIAKRQLELRNACSAKVRGALKAMGHVYTGTSGWHVSPQVTPEKQLGFVDTARGIAVLADGIFFDDETIEAMTVPDQREGVVASGAAHWTSPDVGEGRNASAPDGWKQLVCDIRTFSHCGVEEVATKEVLYGYGYVTCYKDKRFPAAKLDEQSEWPFPKADWWHFSEEQDKRIRKMIADWMRDACKLVAAHLPNAAEVIAALEPGQKHEVTYRLTSGYPSQEDRQFGERTQEVIEAETLSWLRQEAARPAAAAICKEFGIGRVYYARDRDEDIIGMRWIDYFHGVLTRAIYHKLVPVVESLRWMLDLSDLKQHCGNYGPHGETFKEALKGPALNIGRVMCYGLDNSAQQFLTKRLTEVLYENGPVVV